jgi:hypothetical protein
VLEAAEKFKKKKLFHSIHCFGRWFGWEGSLNLPQVSGSKSGNQGGQVFKRYGLHASEDQHNNHPSHLYMFESIQKSDVENEKSTSPMGISSGNGANALLGIFEITIH